MEGKKVLVLFWDNATWHCSKMVRTWIKKFNHKAKKKGSIRLIVHFLPVKSPWLNPIEPCWLHGKKAVFEPKYILSVKELRRRICLYYQFPLLPFLSTWLFWYSNKDTSTRYISTGGSWNDKTPELIKEAAAKHPGKTVILGFDNDDGGKAFEKATRELLKDSGKDIITQYPTQGKDWNDQLTGRDSRKEKAATKQQEQPETAKTTDPAKDYLKELQSQRPQRPQPQQQDKNKGRNFSR